jgi:hypothetical protein
MTRARVQWSSNPAQLERGPMTGPLPVQAAESMARNLRRSQAPPAAVRVVPVVPVAVPLSLFGRRDDWS